MRGARTRPARRGPRAGMCQLASRMRTSGAFRCAASQSVETRSCGSPVAIVRPAVAPFPHSGERRAGQARRPASDPASVGRGEDCRGTPRRSARSSAAPCRDAFELGERAGALVGDLRQRGRRAVERTSRGRPGRAPAPPAPPAAGRRAGPPAARQACGGRGATGAGAAPVMTARNSGPKRSSLTAPTPVMPAHGVERAGAARRELDQRAVGEDHVGGHPGGVGQRAALRLERREQALVLLGDLAPRAPAPGGRGAAQAVGAQLQRAPRRAAPGGRPRSGAARRGAPGRGGQVEAHELAEDRLPLRPSNAPAPTPKVGRRSWPRRSTFSLRSPRRMAIRCSAPKLSPVRSIAENALRAASVASNSSGRSRQRSQLPQGSASVSPK